jgi:PAS domain S-box-containing protein
MKALIGLFWSKYNELRDAIDRDDSPVMARLDAELDPLLHAIVQHQVADPESILAQFRFALDLLHEEADDRGCVARNGHLLQMLVERYLAPQIGRAASARVAGQSADPDSSAEIGEATVLDAELFDRIPERVVVVGRAYKVIYSNETNARRLGRSKEKLLGQHFADLVGLFHFQRDLREAVDRCLSGESLSRTYAEQRDGEVVVVHCRLSPCFADASTQLGALVVMQERADRRRPRVVS